VVGDEAHLTVERCRANHRTFHSVRVNRTEEFTFPMRVLFKGGER